MPQAFKDAESQISWREIAGIGNVIRHDYHDTYPTVLWQTCAGDLKPLKAALKRIRETIEAQNDSQ